METQVGFASHALNETHTKIASEPWVKCEIQEWDASHVKVETHPRCASHSFDEAH